jgi:DNA end-binding protein Ku
MTEAPANRRSQTPSADRALPFMGCARLFSPRFCHVSLVISPRFEKKEHPMSTANCESPESNAADKEAAAIGCTGPRGRPSWSGLLRLSLVAIPVKAYPALDGSAAIHFHQLHTNCGQRIQYQKRCRVHGPVQASDIVRGYPYAPDQYVLVEPEELDKVRPTKDKALVLEQFLPVAQIDPTLFAGRSLYLLPDGVAARQPYGVVAAALQQGGKGALARVVLSTQRHLVLVRPVAGLLVMDLLHYPVQIRPAARWRAELDDLKVGDEEVHLARTLLDAASGPLDWSRYTDSTAAELSKLIDAKLAGQAVVAPTAEPVAVLQLLDALKQSVAAAVPGVPTEQAKPRKPRSPRRASA